MATIDSALSGLKQDFDSVSSGIKTKGKRWKRVPYKGKTTYISDPNSGKLKPNFTLQVETLIDL